MKQFFILLCILISQLAGFSQTSFPDYGIEFDEEHVNRVDILIDPDTLEWIYNNVESNILWHASFIYTTNESADTVDEIGFRLRGNTSRSSAKKSFKVSFNTFHPGRKWHGLEKLNLNGEHNDPSISRSKLCWDLLYDYGLPGSRTSHVALYINGNYYGLYVNVEHIDEEFVESRFGNKDGNLYKCLWPADLDYLGANPDIYKTVMNGDRRAYDLKTNTAQDDYSDLAAFIGVLNNSSDEDFLCAMDTLFNIYDCLKVMAVSIFVGNWDGYIYDMNNFYLYHNTATGKFEFILYDLDNTLGIDFFSRDWANRNIYDWERHGDYVRPLYTRMMAIPELKDQFSFYMNELISQFADPGDYFNQIDSMKLMISQYVANDPYYPLDYGFSYQDFLNSFNQPFGNHVDYGIKTYINTRLSSAAQQLEINNIVPILKFKSWHLDQNNLFAGVYAEDDNPSLSVELDYSFNGGSQQYLALYDDGQHNDGDASDNFYANTLTSIPENTYLLFNFRATDNSGHSNNLPCNPINILIAPSDNPDIVINEFMASNASVIADEYIEYDDWIELYNAGDSDVWLGDKYLSDNLENPSKWALPDVWMEPGSFYLVWADDDTEQGTNHTNFKLDAAGEEIGVFDAEGTGYFPLDTLVYNEQNTDISLGRTPDGGPEWIFFDMPTPGAGNLTGAIEIHENSRFTIYPNPCSASTIHISTLSHIKIYDATGRLLIESLKTSSMDVSDLRKGIYLVVIDEDYYTKLVIQ